MTGDGRIRSKKRFGVICSSRGRGEGEGDNQENDNPLDGRLQTFHRIQEILKAEESEKRGGKSSKKRLVHESGPQKRKKNEKDILDQLACTVDSSSSSSPKTFCSFFLLLQPTGVLRGSPCQIRFSGLLGARGIPAPVVCGLWSVVLPFSSSPSSSSTSTSSCWQYQRMDHWWVDVVHVSSYQTSPPTWFDNYGLQVMEPTLSLSSPEFHHNYFCGFTMLSHYFCL